MSLADYRRKRRFARTPEPKGRRKKSPGRIFVIQQHRARQLHFDLRLELAGTLKSWAVPKGLSLDPAEKRLAVHVEDHPIEYARFEGIIPEGEYGAGTVIVWDRGEWEPLGNADRDYAAGKLKFRLKGEKLNGAWMLVRLRRKEGEDGDNWLVIKERDEAAVPHSVLDIVTDRPESVLTGLTLAEVAGGQHSKGRRTRSRGAQLLKQVKATSDARRAPLPLAMDPALARTVAGPPADNQWLHEIKFDGYRILARLDHGKVQLRTRNGHDWTARFPEIADAIEHLPANTALLDGEVVAFDPKGASSFSALQKALSERGTSKLVYCIFDIPYLEGYDLRQAALEQRKNLLPRLLAGNTNKRLHVVDHILGGGPAFLNHCRELGLEGVVSKRRSGPYRSGRTEEWQKYKCVQSEPFVVGGYATLKEKGHMRALMLGYHDDNGRLAYAGRVGTGFSQESIADLERRLQTMSRPTCPFLTIPPKESGDKTFWVRPQLVAQVRYAGWSNDNILRHSVFEGLRDDTDPLEIVRESVAPAASRVKKREIAKPRSPRRAKGSESEQLHAPADSALTGLKLTHPGKLLYPDIGITKLDLVKFYVQIADWILPHLIDRPLTLVRCPDGIGHEPFYQKHAGPETPLAVYRKALEAGEAQESLYIRDLKGLVSLVQVGVLEIHPWGSRVDRPDRPDRMILDLDPDEAVPWTTVVQAALQIRDRLRSVGLVSFAKNTGKKGVHIVVPLERRHTWDETQQFAQRIARSLERDYPRSYTTNMSKRARPGKTYLDFRRNTMGATAIGPYSTRALADAPVATPLAWDELTPALRPNQFNVTNLADRLLALTADPWAEIGRIRQVLPSLDDAF